MNASNIALLALLLLLVAGCGKKADEHVIHTLEEKVAAEEEKLCFESPKGWMIKTNSSGAVWSCHEAAVQGDVNAQYSLGLISDSDQESAKWFRLAAEQGHRRAQIFLGSIYLSGKGASQDLVSAHMWTSIASRLDNYIPSNDLDETNRKLYLENNENLMRMFSEMIESIEKQMTASQIAEAKKLAEGCITRKFKWC